MSGYGRALLAMPLAMVLVAAPAFADSIYVCKARDGSVVYRDFPCPEESESTAFTGTPQAGPKGGSAAASAGQGLRAGMSKVEVQAILGAPADITQEEGVDGTVVTWTYRDSRTVQFDSGGHLVR
jgi:outer membrane protein assembly factor BamE (lipoprotein component of BamABCDE complex)